MSKATLVSGYGGVQGKDRSLAFGIRHVPGYGGSGGLTPQEFLQNAHEAEKLSVNGAEKFSQ